jgi:hypothetical protein
MASVIDAVMMMRFIKITVVKEAHKCEEFRA